MQAKDYNERFARFATLATFVLITFALWAAREVMLPIAISILLAFLLTPLVIRLQRWGMPKALAIATSVILASALLTGITWVVVSQVVNLAELLPRYEQNIHRKITALKSPQKPGKLSRTSQMLEKFQREVQAPAAPNHDGDAEPTKAEPPPQPVEIKSPPLTPLEMARTIVTPILRPLGTGVIVMVFVIAMLFRREDLRERFITLVSAGKLNTATQAIDDAGERVSRYLLMQLVVNSTYGLPIGIALYFIGVPNALLWGLLSMLLRFIPFIGPWIAAAFPLALAIAVDPGWTKVSYALGVFVVMELLCNNLIEPWLYGHSTGTSNLALLVAAVFWTWLWGPAGLLLSTPLTVCLNVIGKYVPGLSFLSVLLSSESVLEPPTQFYQRMLSMEADDLLDVASKFVDEHSLEEFYDEMFIPALQLSEEDRKNGSLAEERQLFIAQASRDLIEELERKEEGNITPDSKKSAPLPPAVSTGPAVIGIPARDDADEIVGLMLAHLLRRQGMNASVRSLAHRWDTSEIASEGKNPQAIFVSALPPSAVTATRQTCRHLREQFPGVPLVVGVWKYEGDSKTLKERLHPMTPEGVVKTLEEGCSEIGRLTETSPPTVDAPPPAVLKAVAAAAAAR